jgi:precorrin-6Y C5,15-methyltransferase (decarboxylating)
MTLPWLHIVGIGEDGMAGLSPAARAVVEAAEVIVGGDRHHHLSDSVTAERIAWPSPFDAMIGTITAQKGRRAVILVTGDPLWFSVGARILRGIPAGEIVFHPYVSAFQLLACRMGWSLADAETLSVHGRPVAQVIPFFQPGARLLVLTTGAGTPGEIARLLTARGFGASRLTVFGAIGGARETRIEGTAEGWRVEVPAFNVLAAECVAGPEAQVLARVPGLPDEVFATDGNFTKREVRAAALGKLMPMRGALLWDIGCGSGTVAVEWMRAAPDALAIGIEPRADRRALAASNAVALGAPRLDLVAGEAPAALAGLPAPDAVFFGGGLSEAAVDVAFAALRPFGRLVAHAATVEGEAVLAGLRARQGGDLARIAVSRAEPAGGATLWRALAPVTQWSLTKR